MKSKKGKRNNFLYHLGNTLIILSLAGFAYVFLPVINIYLFPPTIKPVAVAAKEKGTFITIPKINAQAPIIENVDPRSKQIYDEKLKEGVAHAKGTKLPQESGTVFLFAHSSGLPWELTRYNTIFLRLGELEAGDKIEIVRNGEIYNYVVREKKEVQPTEVNYLSDTKRDQLILQTCTPIGTSLRRLLVFAEPV